LLEAGGADFIERALIKTAADEAGARPGFDHSGGHDRPPVQ
jgi:hypothetical protein